MCSILIYGWWLALKSQSKAPRPAPQPAASMFLQPKQAASTPQSTAAPSSPVYGSNVAEDSPGPPPSTQPNLESPASRFEENLFESPIKPPGYGRQPTNLELRLPGDLRPWTEYDEMGVKQQQPPYLGNTCRCCGCWGAPCIVWACRCCECCGAEANEVWCKGHWERSRVFLCCGPRWDEESCARNAFLVCCSEQKCCWCAEPAFAEIMRRRAAHAYKQVHIAADQYMHLYCCLCYDWRDRCHPRMAGCTWTCLHCTCLLCPPGCQEVACCREEQLMLDGDIRRIDQPPDPFEIERYTELSA